MQARLTLEDGFTATILKEIRPINLQFQIPMFCASKLQVRYLQIMKVRYSIPYTTMCLVSLL